jgi:hypothetical protein
VVSNAWFRLEADPTAPSNKAAGAAVATFPNFIREGTNPERPVLLTLNLPGISFPNRQTRAPNPDCTRKNNRILAAQRFTIPLLSITVGV